MPIAEFSAVCGNCLYVRILSPNATLLAILGNAPSYGMNHVIMNHVIERLAVKNAATLRSQGELISKNVKFPLASRPVPNRDTSVATGRGQLIGYLS